MGENSSKFWGEKTLKDFQFVYIRKESNHKISVNKKDSKKWLGEFVYNGVSNEFNFWASPEFHKVEVLQEIVTIMRVLNDDRKS